MVDDVVMKGVMVIASQCVYRTLFVVAYASHKNLQLVDLLARFYNRDALRVHVVIHFCLSARNLMMKHLSILRHAKAQNLDESPTDFDRSLAPRGSKDAHQIGKILADSEPSIDWIVSSPAQRTRETASAVVDVLGFKRGVVWQDEIYAGNAEGLLKVLAQVPAEMGHVLLVGHNPGVEELTSGLVAGSPTRLGISMLPAGLAYLTLEIFAWSKIRWGCGTLHALLHPKRVRAK